MELRMKSREIESFLVADVGLQYGYGYKDWGAFYIKCIHADWIIVGDKKTKIEKERFNCRYVQKITWKKEDK